MSAPVFDCRMCGICCEGKGGIVVSPTDLPRISAFLQQSPEEFAAEYGEVHNGKLKIRTGDNGFCVFFVLGQGCSVHPAKPDICRAWPFFRGNIVDSESYAMAKEFCAGIRTNASHKEFVAEGRAYLQDQGLSAENPRTEAIALMGTQA